MTDKTNPLTHRLELVSRRIGEAVLRAGRSPSEVQLLAVSKTRTADEVSQLAAAGQRRFGESYLQDAIGKLDTLAGLGLEWHFIGPIQSNKTRTIAERFDWVHSVDRLKIAERLSEQRPAELPPLNICLQVNISGEQSKSGIELTALPALVDSVTRLPHLRLRGLMCIPSRAQSEQMQRIPFHALAEAQHRLNAAGHRLDTLSMGMSDDLEAAILEGATFVRVGTALFGPRQAPS